MKHILTSTLLVLATLSTISINVTAQTKEDSITCVPTYQLKSAIKDLESFDVCKTENDYLTERVTTLQHQVTLATSIIEVKDSKESELNLQIRSYEISQDLFTKRVDELNKQIRNLRLKNKVLVIGSSTFAIAAITLFTASFLVN